MTSMTIAYILATLLAAILALYIHRGGWWTTLDRVALALHRVCIRGRQRHQRAAANLREDWVRTLEAPDMEAWPRHQ